MRHLAAALTAAALACCATLPAPKPSWPAIDGGVQVGAVVRAELSTADGGTVGVDGGYWLSDSYGLGFTREIARHRGEDAKRDEAPGVPLITTVTGVVTFALGLAFGAWAACRLDGSAWCR